MNCPPLVLTACERRRSGAGQNQVYALGLIGTVDSGATRRLEADAVGRGFVRGEVGD